jgi:hypothetical protein
MAVILNVLGRFTAKCNGMQEVAPWVWEEPPAAWARSIWSDLGIGQWTSLEKGTGKVILNPLLDWDYMAQQLNTRPAALKAEFRVLADCYNRGERWTWPLHLAHDIPLVRPPSMVEQEADKERAKAWAMANLKGTYKNEATGWEVDVAGRGIKEALTHLDWDSPASLQTIAAIPELLRVAVPVQTEPNKNPEAQAEIRQVHTLLAPILVYENVRRARITVRETNMGEKYYGHRLESLDIETSGALPGGLRGDAPPTDPQHPDTIKVSQLLAGFKPHRGAKP